MEKGQNPEFLRQKYQLEKSEDVERAVSRKKSREGERVRREPTEQIQAYLDRLDLVFNPPQREGSSFDRKQRNVNMMKRVMHENLIVKPEVATEGYLKHQQTMAQERGHGEVDIPERVKDKVTDVVKTTVEGGDLSTELQDFSDEEKQMAEEIVAKIEEQKQSLDGWIDYLSSDDAKDYPDWLKYWAMRSVTGLSSYDKDEKRFPTRDETTTNPFPDLNQEALAYILDVVKKDVAYKQELKASQEELKRAQKKHNKERQQIIATKIAEIKQRDPSAKIDRARIIQEIDLAPFDASTFDVELPEDQRDVEPELQRALDAQDFAKLYAFAIESVTPAPEGILHNTKGRWVKYEKGSDHMQLVQALQGHGTGWCTAGENVAKSQLSRGDFYVYYSQDEDGEDTIPRSAIRMEGDEIAEVRGIDQDQNLDPYIGEVVQEKMHEFPDGKEYEKKAGDMKRVTEIHNKSFRVETDKQDPEEKSKIYLNPELSAEDLKFIYEIDSKIEGFGYDSDPRVKELRDARDPEADMPIVFECEPEQIARTVEAINDDTVAYVGPLEPGIFNKLPDSVEHIYTSFPERPILRQTIEIGGKTKDQLLEELKEKSMKVYEYAEKMMNHSEFTVSKEKEDANLIRLSVADLGLPGNPTTTQVCERAKELGLELVPAEVGPQYRLQYEDQPSDEYLYMGMETIPGPGGRPCVFKLFRVGDGLWLHNGWADPDNQWLPYSVFVFRARKSDS